MSNYPDGMRSGRGRITVEMRCNKCGYYDDVPGIDEPWGFFPDDHECPKCGADDWEC